MVIRCPWICATLVNPPSFICRRLLLTLRSQDADLWDDYVEYRKACYSSQDYNSESPSLLGTGSQRAPTNLGAGGEEQLDDNLELMTSGGGVTESENQLCEASGIHIKWKNLAKERGESSRTNISEVGLPAYYQVWLSARLRMRQKQGRY